MLNHISNLTKSNNLERIKVLWSYLSIKKKINFKYWEEIAQSTSTFPKIPQLRGLNGISGAQKYFNFEKFMRLNISRYYQLNLKKKNLNIVDLGCGAGYFVYFAGLKGHNALGLDRATSPEFDPIGPEVFNLMTNFFGIRKVSHNIQPFVPLPIEINNCDLITAFNAWFDGNYLSGTERKYCPWDLKTWEYFLEDSISRLNSMGRLYLDVNEKWEYQKGYYYPQNFVEMLEKFPIKIKRFEKNILDIIKD